MGLELLEAEFKTASDKATSNEAENATGQDHDSIVGLNSVGVDSEDVAFWSNVTNDIKDNANTAVEILNDMLNYDKLEHGGLNLELSRVRVAEVVDRTVRQFQIQAVNRRVNLVLHIEGWNDQQDLSNDLDCSNISSSHPIAWRTIGDEVRLGQVLRNLISNALKFTPAEGNIDVTAQYIRGGLANAKPLCLAQDECGECAFGQMRAGSVKITIKDTGIGLTKDQLAKLFGEGVQFDANKLQHGGGSGLGLNIAKGIVEQHSGTIHAESEGQGHGTSFVMELPLYQFHDEDKTNNRDDDRTYAMSTVATSSVAAPPSSSIVKVTTQEQRSIPISKRVLVVEDAVSSLKMLIRLLERAGHTCVGASNGQVAMDTMKEDLEAKRKDPAHHIPFDTILIDFEMPLVNGPTATTQIREMGYRGNIVGVTGNVLSEDVQLFRDAGADEVLAKPISMARIDGFWAKERAKFQCNIRKSNRSSEGGDEIVKSGSNVSLVNMAGQIQ